MSGHTEIIVVAYALADELVAMYESIVTQPLGIHAHWQIFLHSKQPDVVDAVESIAKDNSLVRVLRFKHNRGLAKSWNDGWVTAMRNRARHILIANDDARAAPGDLDKLCRLADEHPEAYMVSGYGWDERNQERRDQLFSLAVMTETGYRRVGMFDEHFRPLYWEDIDWYRRADLLGLHRIAAASTDIWHAGSLTYRTQQNHAEHNLTFHQNRQYYEQKWGGPKGMETYDHPFGDNKVPLYIHPYDRPNPYPKHAPIDLRPMEREP